MKTKREILLNHFGCVFLNKEKTDNPALMDKEQVDNLNQGGTTEKYFVLIKGRFLLKGNVYEI